MRTYACVLYIRTCFLSYVLSVDSSSTARLGIVAAKWPVRHTTPESESGSSGPRMRRALIVRNAALNAYDELVPWACVSFRVPVEALKTQL